MNTLIRCTVTVEDAAVEQITGLLAMNVPFGWEEESLPTGETCFCIHCASKEFMDTLTQTIRTACATAVVHCEDVPEKDWALAWREYFTPIECGTRFMVLPPWLRESTDTAGRTPIIIEPKSAFGTGHHATTALCLRVLSDLLDAGRVCAGMRFLDLGTGSGILAIACGLSGLTGIGADVDILAVENALENRTLNALHVPAHTLGTMHIMHGGMECVQGHIFDVVLANILARPLQELAPEIVAVLRPAGQITGHQKHAGCLVLSGLLAVQAPDVIAAYSAQGLAQPRTVQDGDWVALVWE